MPFLMLPLVFLKGHPEKLDDLLQALGPGHFIFEILPDHLSIGNTADIFQGIGFFRFFHAELADWVILDPHPVKAFIADNCVERVGAAFGDYPGAPGVSFEPGELFKPGADLDLVCGKAGLPLGFFEVFDEGKRAGLCGSLTFGVSVLGEGEGKVLEALSLPFGADTGGHSRGWIDGEDIRFYILSSLYDKRTLWSGHGFSPN
jgi:hypothetical protein